MTDDPNGQQQPRAEAPTPEQQQLADLQAKYLEATRHNQQLSTQIAGGRLAASMGLIDAEAALALVQHEHGDELEYDAQTGAPTNLDTLLKQVLAAHPALAQSAQQQQRTQPPRPASSGGATNPGGASSGAPTFTRASIAAMSGAEYERNRAAIYDAMNKGLIR
jgi:hypothetical protein